MLHPPRLSVLFLSVAVVACFRSADAAAQSRPAARDSGTSEAATDRLVTLLHSAFKRAPSESAYEYWRKHDIDTFWRDIETTITRGADATAAGKRGANVWSAVFVGNPRCYCAPYGWPDTGRATRKCPNPDYFKGCEEEDEKAFLQRTAFLVNHGVDPNLAYESDGTPPLCNAANLYLDDVVAILLAHGAQCSSPCVAGSAMRSAAVMQAPRMLCALIQCGTPVNLLDSSGDAALFKALAAHRTRNIAILLDYGADPTTKNSRGEDLFTLARKQRNHEVSRLLKAWKSKGGKSATRSLCVQ